MTRVAMIGVSVWLVWATPAQAQTPPATTPAATCAYCQALQQGIEALEKQLKEVEDRQKQLDQDMEKSAGEMQKALEEEARLRAQAAEAGDFVSGETKSRLSQLDATIRDIQLTQWPNRMQWMSDEYAERRLRQQIEALREALSKCGQSCTAAPQTPQLTTGGPGSAACEDCDALKARLDFLDGRLSDVRERLNSLERVQQDVEGLKAGAKADQVPALDGQIQLLRTRHRQAAQEQSELWKEHRELQQKLKNCGTSCKPKQTSQLFRGPLPYIVGGAGAVAVATLAGGGDTTTTIANIPTAPAITPTQPTATANPAPPQQPAQDAIDVLMGVYLVQACVCELDQGGQDSFLRVCQSVRQWRLTRTGANTVRIEGDAPLITSDFILDANARTIDGNAAGAAGSLRYTGSFGSGGSVTMFLNFSNTNAMTRYRVTALKQ